MFLAWDSKEQSLLGRRNRELKKGKLRALLTWKTLIKDKGSEKLVQFK
jgi:hypothetical protein